MNFPIFFTLFSLFLFIGFSPLTAQKTSKGLTGVRAGIYADNGLSPGLKLGTSYLLNEKTKSRKYLIKPKARKRKNQFKKIQYLLDGNIGFYNHFSNHIGMFAGIGFTKMKIKTEKKQTFAWSLEINYLRKFYNLETFELNEQGEVEQIKGAGTNNLMFAIAPSWGRVLGTKNGGEGLHLYFKPSFQMVEYNHAFFLNTALELGVNLNILSK